MKSSSIFRLGVAGLFALSSLSCGKKDIDKIGEAQACLDSATSSTVSQCTEKVSGIESSQAYLIRCAAKFIEEGFSESSRLTQAYSQMTNSGTGGAGANASLAVLQILAFKAQSTGAANSSNVSTTQSYCVKSNSKGLILLSSIAGIATVAYATALSLSMAFSSGADAQAALNAAKDDPSAQALVGAAAAAAYTSNCSGGQTSNEQFCSQFSQAVANTSGGVSNQTCLGKQMLYYYSNPSGTAPSCP